ncbi:hypothetical protein DBV15_05748, partial [Temnothorax longispinosus]
LELLRNNFFVLLFIMSAYLSPPHLPLHQMLTHWIMQGTKIGNVENYYAMDGRVDFTLLRLGNLRSLEIRNGKQWTSFNRRSTSSFGMAARIDIIANQRGSIILDGPKSLDLLAMIVDDVGRKVRFNRYSPIKHLERERKGEGERCAFLSEFPVVIYQTGKIISDGWTAARNDSSKRGIAGLFDGKQPDASGSETLYGVRVPSGLSRDSERPTSTERGDLRRITHTGTLGTLPTRASGRCMTARGNARGVSSRLEEPRRRRGPLRSV